MKVKLLREEFETYLDDLINEWLEENDVLIKDIKLINIENNLVALIIYE